MQGILQASWRVSQLLDPHRQYPTFPEDPRPASSVHLNSVGDLPVMLCCNRIILTVAKIPSGREIETPMP
jgi:hypothetical protein